MSKEIKWSIDQTHSEITFKVRHLMISNVRGSFKKFDASIYTSDKDFKNAVIDLWIDTSSIDTGDAKRDEHLQSEDFFDLANHKQITFISRTIGKADAKGNHELWGELAMRGITKNIKLNVLFGGIVTDPFGNEKAGFAVSGTINRSDWELGWNKSIEKGGLLLSDEVEIMCEIELTNVSAEDLKMELEG